MMLSFEEALEIVLDLARTLGSENVSITHTANRIGHRPRVRLNVSGVQPKKTCCVKRHLIM